MSPPVYEAEISIAILPWTAHVVAFGTGQWIDETLEKGSTLEQKFKFIIAAYLLVQFFPNVLEGRNQYLVETLRKTLDAG